MLHITFTDGSNPYFFRGNIKRELKRWSRNYHLTNGFMSRFGVYFVTATPKRDSIDLFNFD